MYLRELLDPGAPATVPLLVEVPPTDRTPTQTLVQRLIPTQAQRCEASQSVLSHSVHCCAAPVDVLVCLGPRGPVRHGLGMGNVLVHIERYAVPWVT